MESDPPPVPVLLSPASSERVGHLGGQTPEFKWKAVSDPSGVSYDLSIAKDEAFNNVVLTKTNLPINTYTPSKKEALEKGNYYWRVRAIDGASNSSNWSNASALQIGSNLLFWLLGISLSSLAGTAVFLRLFVGFTSVQRKAIAEARTTQNAKRAAQLEVEKTQRAELDRIEEQILEMARKNRGGLKIDSITASLSIDPITAKRCLEELKAYQEGEWYFFPDVEKSYKKEN
jgi:hypothetical protein